MTHERQRREVGMGLTLRPLHEAATSVVTNRSRVMAGTGPAMAKVCRTREMIGKVANCVKGCGPDRPWRGRQQMVSPALDEERLCVSNV